MPKFKIDPQWARNAFEYDPETGGLTYKPIPEKMWKDKVFNDRMAGTNAIRIVTESSGDRRQCVWYQGRYYVAARIMWAIAKGEDPGPYMIDHKNRNPLDNRLENLRLADAHGNGQNRKRSRNNKTGYVGVTKGVRGGFGFHVQGPDGKRIFRSGFLTARHAAEARDELAKVLHGEFYRSAIEEYDENQERAA